MTDDVPKDRVKELRQETVLCRVKYHNNLPELPFDPKFLAYPFESSRFVQYAATSLERNHKHELLCQSNVGVDVDLIDPEAFKIDRNGPLHPDDEKLLEDDDPNADNDRRSRHRRSVAWMRKTEYLSTEHYNKFNKSEKIETKLGHNVKQRFSEEIVYRDKDSQIRAIESTFTAAKKPITNHYSKRDVRAVEVLPVLPDFVLWKYPCAQVIFDDDPTRSSEHPEEVNEAVIRGMVDNIGDHFVVYFLPTEETKEQRRRDAENHVAYSEDVLYEYDQAREYNWNVKNKTMANYEESYFFVFRDASEEYPAGVFYNELETRVRLSKRRKVRSAFGRPQPVRVDTGKVRLMVKHREFNFEESQAQLARLEMLKHESELEEVEESGAAASGSEGNQEADDDEEMQSDNSSMNSPASSPVAGTSSRRSSGHRSEGDDGGGRSSLEENDDEDSEKAASQSRGQSSMHKPVANVFSSSDEDDADNQESPVPVQHHPRQESESSDLSDSSPKHARYSSNRISRKRPSPEDENSASEEEGNSPSPPPRNRRRQDFNPLRAPSSSSASRRAPLSESEDDLSSLSD
ncbi:hypothetical protein Aperf_G00000016948 [Anoplocephala perfoliata]